MDVQGEDRCDRKFLHLPHFLLYPLYTQKTRVTHVCADTRTHVHTRRHNIMRESGMRSTVGGPRAILCRCF